MIEFLKQKPLGKSFCTIEPMTMMAVAAGAQGAGSIFGGIFGSSAAKQQAAAIRESAEIASRTALEMDNRARADVAPFREQGIEAGNTLMNLLTGGGDVSAVTQASPLFQFQSEIGMRNINRELSARGLFGSGAGLETLQRFNNQLVGEEADRLFTRLFNVNTLGANAAARMATNTANTGNNIAGIQANAGIAAAGATAAGTNAIGGAVSGGFNAIAGGLNQFAQYQMYQPLIQRLTGGGGGGGYSRPDMGFNPATAGRDMSLTG